MTNNVNKPDKNAKIVLEWARKIVVTAVLLLLYCNQASAQRLEDSPSSMGSKSQWLDISINKDNIYQIQSVRSKIGFADQIGNLYTGVYLGYENFGNILYTTTPKLQTAYKLQFNSPIGFLLGAGVYGRHEAINYSASQNASQAAIEDFYYFRTPWQTNAEASILAYGRLAGRSFEVSLYANNLITQPFYHSALSFYINKSDAPLYGGVTGEAHLQDFFGWSAGAFAVHEQLYAEAGFSKSIFNQGIYGDLRFKLEKMVIGISYAQALSTVPHANWQFILLWDLARIRSGVLTTEKKRIPWMPLL